ncbi:hypothetical protein [Paenibacillus sp. P32E]|uniref:hypothetical protein n=1 Tax=Paenibacillus sp. P32E TaxID=1349434 RepID=UPI0015B9B82D|nr:hypothetical protein [Paenibacillus sp. P32E]
MKASISIDKQMEFFGEYKGTSSSCVFWFGHQKISPSWGEILLYIQNSFVTRA